jgi:hypothetical protein
MRVRQPRAGKVDGFEAQVFNDASRKRSGGTGQQQSVAAFDPHAKASPNLGL